MIASSRGLAWAVLSLFAFVAGAPAFGESTPTKEAPVPPASGEQSADKPAADKPEAQPVKLRWAHIVIKGDYPEGAQSPGLFGDLTESLADGLARIGKAADDDGVDGVVLHIKGPNLGWGKLHEFRRAIAELRKSKPVYAWMESATSKDYLLATACNRIVLPESGMVMMVGLRAEVGFYKNLFDKLSIEAEILRVGEYKSAAEPFTRTEMSPEFREEMEEILDDYWRQMVETIAESRKLEREKVVAAIDSGPHSAKTAHELGLIDEVAYEDEFEKLLRGDDERNEVEIVKGYGKKKIDTDFSGFTGMIKFMNLLMGVESSSRRNLKPKIAVIHATGPITSGESKSDLFGEQSVGSETIVKAIRTAREDDTVKAIVLRVDSPGGSALASDIMWRELEITDKPIVVSMGDVAASGGYYISMGADAIFAEPGTLTGSIGVVGGKLALEGLYEKIGITTSVVSRGKHSGTLSMLEGFSDSERKAMQKLLDEIYEQFTRKAAAGRGMKVADLEKLARGRVYTGEMAKKLDLVDEIGTLDDAVGRAQKLAKLEGDEIDRLILPKPKSPFEALFGPIDSEETRADAGAPASTALFRELRSISPELARHLRTARIIGILARESRLTLMPFHVEIR